MTCDELRDDVLSEFMKDELPPDAAEQLERHLRACRACRKKLAWLSKIASELAALGGKKLTVSETVAELLALDKTPSSRISTVKSTRRRPEVAHWWYAAAAAIAVAAALSFAIGPASSSRTQRKLADRTQPAVAPAENQVPLSIAARPEQKRSLESAAPTPSVHETSPEDLSSADVPPEVAGPPGQFQAEQQPNERASEKVLHAAYVDRVQGPAELLSGRRSVPVQAGMPLELGDSLKTLSSRVCVRFESGSVLHLNRFTGVRFVSFSPPAVELTSGEIYAEVAELDKGFAVDTPHGRAIDLGTRFGVTIGALGTTVCVLEGRVELRTDAGRRELDNGHEALLAHKLAPPGQPKKAKDIAGRFAWVLEDDRLRAESKVVYLSEDFEDPALAATRWWKVPGRFITKMAEVLEIDPSRAIRSGRPEWLGPGGAQSRAAYTLPLRVSLDVEVTHRHEGLLAAVLFMPQGVWSDSEKGDVFRVELRADTYGLVVQSSRYLVQKELKGPWPRREHWTVEVSGDEVRLAVGDREVLRYAHGRNVYRAYHIRPECNATGNAPAEARVRFDNIVIEPTQLGLRNREGGTR